MSSLDAFIIDTLRRQQERSRRPPVREAPPAPAFEEDGRELEPAAEAEVPAPRGVVVIDG